MGFRNYAPSLNQFLSRDMYDGALSDMGLDTDPFTGNRYTFGAGNPISNIELTGHRACSPSDVTADCDVIRGAPAPAPSAPSAPQCQLSDNRCITVTPNPGLPGFQMHSVIVPFVGYEEWCTYGDKTVNCSSYAQYADYAVKYAKEAGIDPVFLMAILLNEQKPFADIPYRSDRGVGSMKLETFTQAEEYAAKHGITFSGDWNKSASDPALSIEATAWKLRRLADETIGPNYKGTRKQDEIIAAEYNGVYGDWGKPGPTFGGRPVFSIPYIGRIPYTGGKGWAYVQNLNNNWPEANQLICQSGVYTCTY
jgi:hypothetical protein